MDDFLTRIEKMGRAIAPYAKSKADRTYIENYLRSKKAILMQSSPVDCQTVAAKESYAYSHPEYIDLINGLRSAVEIEEKAKWALEKFKIEFEHWRTIQANDRWQKNNV